MAFLIPQYEAVKAGHSPLFKPVGDFHGHKREIYFASLGLMPALSTSFATRGRSLTNSRACASGVC